uniref:Lipocalin 15 n=1 Tax=Pongo abelii TaxID=9601 RepID=A0A8I5UB60_PONAB
MMSFLLSAILALLWAPTAQAEVLLQPDFNAEKFSGLWYVVSMKDHLSMSTRAIRPTEEGGLHVHMEFLEADGCNQVDAEYLKVGSEGHFRGPALGYLDVRIVDTDYSSFAVLYIYKQLEGARSTTVQLYTECRTQNASPQALKAFQDFYPTLGLPEDMMVMLPKSGTLASPARPTPSSLALPSHEPTLPSPHSTGSVRAASGLLF